MLLSFNSGSLTMSGSTKKDDRHIDRLPACQFLFGEAETLDLVEIGSGAPGETLNVAVPKLCVA